MLSKIQAIRTSVFQPLALLAVVALFASNQQQANAQRVPSANLGNGVNFGAILEAPYEGAWGLRVEPEFFERVSEAGFGHIRLPVSWTYHALTEAPYTVDPEFFGRIDEILAMAQAIDVKLILNDHHHEELDTDPIGERERFLAIWDQIATRYADRGDWLLFEILNEPHGQFDIVPGLWNEIQQEALNVIRTTNPTRKVLIAPLNFNSIAALDQLEIPDDPNLIASVHYYSPFFFTHQGAPWVVPTPPTGVVWRPFYFSFADPWINFSWNTKVESTGSGLRVTYQEAYAGFQVRHATPLTDAQAFQFRVNRPYRLQVILFDGDERIDYPIQSTATPGNEKLYTVNFDNLPDGFKVQNIAIQNFDSDSQIPMIVSVLRIKRNDEWSFIMTTETNIQRLHFREARDWAIANNIPLHLGEFGAAQFGNLEHRVNWTRSVRNTAEVLGIDWCYWELAAENFGIYDPVNHVWRTDLRRALLPFLR